VAKAGGYTKNGVQTPLVIAAEEGVQKWAVWGLKLGTGNGSPPCTGRLTVSSGFLTLSSG